MYMCAHIFLDYEREPWVAILASTVRSPWLGAGKELGGQGSLSSSGVCRKLRSYLQAYMASIFCKLSPMLGRNFEVARVTCG